MTASPGSGRDGDLAYQARVLQAVSRTYALTIPALPDRLRPVVGNAYLLCRITDTIEDEPGLSPARKQVFWERLIEVVAGRRDAASFGLDLAAALTPATPEAERELAAGADRILRVTAGLRAAQRAAIERCIRVMSRGMAEFQRDPGSVGLKDLGQLDRYCYFVAGVVGEMLVELFCDYSDEIESHRKELTALAVSHAQGLQMANILKDVWDDWENGACWLPEDVFRAAGFDLVSLAAGGAAPGFDEGLSRLVAITRGHLSNALRFILLIPRREAGIRRHLLWAVGLAVLVLRRIHRNPSFRQGHNVRLSRVSVGVVVAVTSVAARRDSALRFLFRVATRGLPPVAQRDS
ncbi:MAG: squalene/phytoene synthase family protein [Acidobacteriota bacterium]|nr:squalene/phytoene synthase family protein [Acidobacteriota bacterium]